MSLIDVIKYSIPDNAVLKDIEPIPLVIINSFVKRYGRKTICHPDFDTIRYLRKELLIWDETPKEQFIRVIRKILKLEFLKFKYTIGRY